MADVQLHHRHLDEAEFLFEVFDAALESPRFDLDQLARGPERRLWAHVDALVLAGGDWCGRNLVPVLREKDQPPARVAAASLVLAELPLGRSALTDPLARLRAAVPEPQPTWAHLLALHDACEAPELRRAICRGMALSSSPDLSAWLHTQLRAHLHAVDGPGLVGRLRILVDRGEVPEALASLLGRKSPELLALALEASKRSDDPKALARVSALGQAEDPSLRVVALESALIHAIPGAWASALYWGSRPKATSVRARAWIWLALLGDAEVHAWLLEQLSRVDDPGPLLWAAGFCGRAAAVDAALAWLDHAELAPLAGELVVAITGLSPTEPGCWAAPSEVGEAEALPPLSAAELDAELVPRPSDALAWPVPEGIRAWWAKRRADFDPKLRYLGGRPLTTDVLLDALAAGPMRRRHMLALELALRSQGRLHVHTRQTSARQREQLAAIAAAPELAALDLQRGLGRAQAGRG